MFIVILFFGVLAIVAIVIARGHRDIARRKAILQRHLDGASYAAQKSFVDANGTLAVAHETSNRRFVILENVGGQVHEQIIPADNIRVARLVENGTELSAVRHPSETPPGERSKLPAELVGKVETLVDRMERVGVKINVAQTKRNIDALIVEIVVVDDTRETARERYPFQFVQSEGAHLVVNRGSKSHRKVLSEARQWLRIFAQAMDDAQTEADAANPSTEPTVTQRPDDLSDDVRTRVHAGASSGPESLKSAVASGGALPSDAAWVRQRETAFQSPKKG